jgi:hypothetical protein
LNDDGALGCVRWGLGVLPALACRATAVDARAQPGPVPGGSGRGVAKL